MEKRLLKAELVKICNKPGSLEPFLIRGGLKAAVCFISVADWLGYWTLHLKSHCYGLGSIVKLGFYTLKNVLGLL